jgi:Protein of unknown function (DUF3140)
MTPKELERWLDPEESKVVGWTREEDEESIGHKWGRRIVQLKRKKVAELSDDGLTRICKGWSATCTGMRRSARTETSRRRAGASRS